MIKAAKYFRISELVSPIVFEKFGNKAWRFIDPKLIETLDFLRYSFGKPMVINDWKWGGGFTQRGLRENICPITKLKTTMNELYLSAHVFGKAADFHVKGYSTEYIKKQIVLLKAGIPHPIRMERETNGWIHIDMMTGNSSKIIKYF